MNKKVKLDISKFIHEYLAELFIFLIIGLLIFFTMQIFTEELNYKYKIILSDNGEITSYLTNEYTENNGDYKFTSNGRDYTIHGFNVIIKKLK